MVAARWAGALLLALLVVACGGARAGAAAAAAAGGGGAGASWLGGLSRPAFPRGFVFGTATSAYQVEGAASTNGRGPSTWDPFVHTPGTVVIASRLYTQIQLCLAAPSLRSCASKLGFEASTSAVFYNCKESDAQANGNGPLCIGPDRLPCVRCND